jgi:hypothetical protein
MSAISILAVPALLLQPHTSQDPLRPPQKPSYPRTTASQFSTMYAIGRVTQPPLTILTASAFFYLAYRAHGSTITTSPTTLPHGIAQGVRLWQLWACGGAVVLGALWPFTFLVLEPVSQRLLVFAREDGGGDIMAKMEEGRASGDEQEEEQEEEVREVQALLYRWGVLNLIRACLPAVGAGCGFWAVFFGAK